MHVLDKEEFVEVRTNRNKYKITDDEQNHLAAKKIGVIGLSVGQSVALTMIQERVCGEIRVADYDTLELSNLNRIRTPIWNLGVNKAINVAREIAEIDPYVKVVVFDSGLTEDNLDQFFSEGGNLDLLVEECDGLDMKILARIKARELGVPVIMETNDRCMIDIERFDLEPESDLLHGLAEGMDLSLLKSLKTNEDKVPYVLQLIGIDKTTKRLRASMLEIEQSILTWPQLASSVAGGAAVLTSFARRILLGKKVPSGRFYHDFEEFIEPVEPNTVVKTDIQVLSKSRLNGRPYYNASVSETEPSTSDINKIIDDCLKAPSAANNQPWQWVCSNGQLYLYHDIVRSKSSWDPNHFAACVSMGCAIRNLQLSSARLQYRADITFNYQNINLPEEPLASIRLVKDTSEKVSQLYQEIGKRQTNRSNAKSKSIPGKVLNQLRQSLNTYSTVDMRLLTDPSKKANMSVLLGELERIRLLNSDGHRDFINEIRWNPEENQQKRDGVDIRTVDLTNTERAGLQIGKDPDVISLLREWQMGSGFDKIITKGVDNCFGLAFFIVDESSTESLIAGGTAIQNYWLTCSKQNVQVHPLASAAILFNTVNHTNNLQRDELMRIREIKDTVFGILDINPNQHILMTLRLSVHNAVAVRSLRKNKSDSFIEISK